MGNIIRIYETSNSTDTEINYNLSIPTKLSNCIYSIKVEDSFLILNCIEMEGIVANLTSYNFNIKIKNDIIYSTNGLLQITAEYGEIDIE